MTLQRKDNTVFCAVCGGSWHFMHLPLAQLDCPAANCSANPQRGNGAVVAYIGFYKFDDAKDHRSRNGGWIFLSNDDAGCWLSLAHILRPFPDARGSYVLPGSAWLFNSGWFCRAKTFGQPRKLSVNCERMGLVWFGVGLVPMLQLWS